LSSFARAKLSGGSDDVVFIIDGGGASDIARFSRLPFVGGRMTVMGWGGGFSLCAAAFRQEKADPLGGGIRPFYEPVLRRWELPEAL